jgi:localization factor PodJL
VRGGGRRPIHWQIGAVLDYDRQMAERGSARHAPEARLWTLLLLALLLIFSALLLTTDVAQRIGRGQLLPPSTDRDAAAATPASAPPDEAQIAAAASLARASGGEPAAQFEIATRYAAGNGVPRDDARAASWFREAAINGIATAQYDLGVLYETGRGLAADPIEAMIWYQSAADQNHPVAQYRLGMISLAGSVIPSNPAETARWFRRAAEQGLAAAQFALAGLYERGDGMAPSPSEAFVWYSLAAASDHPGADAAAARLAGALSPELLGDAQSQAAALAARIPPASPDLGDDTGGLLLSPSPSRIAAAPPSRGMVSEIQRLLRAADYDPGPVDGLPGELTVQAIRRYQLDAGLPVDGVPDATVLSHLRATAAGRPPAAEP